MPNGKHSVYLDGVKAQELDRRASMSALAESDIEDNLDSELTDLVAGMRQMSIELKNTVCAWPRGRVPHTISTNLQGTILQNLEDGTENV